MRRGDLIVSRANTRDLVGAAAVVDGDFPWLMLCGKLYGFTLNETPALPRFVATVPENSTSASRPVKSAGFVVNSGSPSATAVAVAAIMRAAAPRRGLRLLAMTAAVRRP